MPVPESLLDQIERLDPAPSTLKQLVGLARRPEAGVDEVTRAVEYDTAVAANVLRVAGNGTGSLRCGVMQLRQAVVTLGPSAILEIALGSGFRSNGCAAQSFNLSEQELWLHGAAASMAAQAMIQEAEPGCIPPDAGIAALLHDIGKLILVRHMGVNLTALSNFCREMRIPFVAAEREVLGFDHAEMGAALARRWGFPPAIARAIESHHSLPTAQPDPMLDVVVLANEAAKSAVPDPGFDAARAQADCREPLLRLGIAAAAFKRVRNRTAEQVHELVHPSGKGSRHNNGG